MNLLEMYLFLMLLNFSSIYLQISSENLTVKTSKNMANSNDLMFILPSSTVQIQDKYFPKTVEPSLKVLSRELFYKTSQ